MTKNNNNSKIEKGILKALSTVFPKQKLSLESLKKNREKFEDWDSLNHMQLVSEIESVFGISLDMDEIININEPSDFVPLIEKRGVKI